MLNIQGMDPSARSRSKWKIPYLHENYVLENNYIPVIALSETWLKSYISDAQIAIPHYNIIRSDRKTRKRGGVLLYVHEDLPTCSELAYDNEICEAVMCTIESIKTIVISVYRPPDTKNEEFVPMMKSIEEYISKASVDSHKDIIVMGDFNIPCVDWTDNSIKPGYGKDTTECADTLLTFMANNLASQYIDKPTRLNNTLDLLISNNDHNYFNAVLFSGN